MEAARLVLSVAGLFLFAAGQYGLIRRYSHANAMASRYSWGAAGAFTGDAGLALADHKWVPFAIALFTVCSMAANGAVNAHIARHQDASE